MSSACAVPRACLRTSNIPMQRYAQPSDIAKVMAFLASDDAAFLTGSVYMADGGSTAK